MSEALARVKALGILAVIAVAIVTVFRWPVDVPVARRAALASPPAGLRLPTPSLDARGAPPTRVGQPPSSRTLARPIAAEPASKLDPLPTMVREHALPFTVAAEVPPAEPAPFIVPPAPRSNAFRKTGSTLAGAFKKTGAAFARAF